MKIRALTSAVVVTGLMTGSLAFGGVTYLGKVMIDGKGKDLSGLTGKVEDGSRADGLDGFGSGLAYTGISPAPGVYRFVSIADRGPNRTEYSPAVDNTTSYATRFQTWDIAIKPAEGGKFSVSATLVKTTLFSNERGEKLVGRSDQFVGEDPVGNLRFDPESVRVAPDGTLYVSDEYGPSVYHFDEHGKRIGAMKVPAYYQVKKLSARGEEEIAGNKQGRVANKGFEGLAITPDGSQVIAAIQAPLIQDGGDKTRYERLAVFDTRTGEVAHEFAYALDGEGNSAVTTISDIVAINDHQILVDERDGKKNKTKLAYIAELNGATDVKGRVSILTAGKLDSSIVPAKKTLLFDVKETIMAADDLLKVPAGYTAGVPDKIEGFAFGPRLVNGKQLLVVTNDNDFLLPAFVNGTSKTNASTDGTAGYPNYFFVFEVDLGSVPGFAPEEWRVGPAARAAGE